MNKIIEISKGESMRLNNSIEIINHSDRKISISNQDDYNRPVISFENSQQIVVLSGIRNDDIIHVIEVDNINHNIKEDNSLNRVLLQYKLNNAYDIDYYTIRCKEIYMRIKKTIN